MSITLLDHHTALIVIDLQKGIVSAPTVHPLSGIIQQASTLAQAFRRRALPVVLVAVTGVPGGRTEQTRSGGGSHSADWADIVPELNQQPTDHIVRKQTWGAFTGTNLEQHLRALSVTQVVLAGVATSIGVESTARQAHELGFNVSLVTDAMTDINSDAHSNSITRIFPRLGETGTTKEIMALLEGR